jgi:hypothetical protein
MHMDEVSIVDAISTSLLDWPLATRRSLACTSVAWRDQLRRHFKDTIRVREADCTRYNGIWYAKHVKRVSLGPSRVPRLVAEGNEDWEINKSELFANPHAPFKKDDMDRLGVTAAFFIGFLLSEPCEAFNYTLVTFKVAGFNCHCDTLASSRPELNYKRMSPKELALLAGCIDAMVVGAFAKSSRLPHHAWRTLDFSDLLMHHSTAEWAVCKLRRHCANANANAAHLFLKNVGISSSAGIIEPLLASPTPWTTITTLSLSRVDLLSCSRHRVRLASAFDAGAFPNLEKLDLSRCGLRVEGIRDLGRSINRLKKLAHLNLELNQLSDYAMDYVRFTILMPKLELVQLKFNAYTFTANEEMALFIRKNKARLPKLKDVCMDIGSDHRPNPVKRAIMMNMWEELWKRSCLRMDDDAKEKDLDACPSWTCS